MWTFFHFDVVDSTNNVARSAGLCGCPGLTAFVAREQTAGRGRRSRTWASPPGGLWMSLLLRPEASPRDWPLITLAVGVAVTRVVRSLGIDAEVKWPNDVVVGSKKLCGILCESVLPVTRVEARDGASGIKESAASAGDGFVVAGIGLNLNVDTALLPQAVRTSATSVFELTGRKFELEEVAHLVAFATEAQIERLSRGESAALLNEWRSLCPMLRKRVRVETQEGAFFGVAIDVDSDGALLVDTGASVRKVVAADVSVRPVDSAMEGTI